MPRRTDCISSFLAEIIVNGRDMTDEYYNREMAEKYENNAKKEVVHDLIVGGDVEYLLMTNGSITFSA